MARSGGDDAASKNETGKKNCPYCDVRVRTLSELDNHVWEKHKGWPCTDSHKYVKAPHSSHTTPHDSIMAARTRAHPVTPTLVFLNRNQIYRYLCDEYIGYISVAHFKALTFLSEKSTQVFIQGCTPECEGVYKGCGKRFRRKSNKLRHEKKACKWCAVCDIFTSNTIVSDLR
jgi:hypothetical protein